MSSTAKGFVKVDDQHALLVDESGGASAAPKRGAVRPQDGARCWRALALALGALSGLLAVALGAALSKTTLSSYNPGWVSPRVACSMHGTYEDGLCRCDDCWDGARCEFAITASSPGMTSNGSAAPCVSQADTGTPYLFEDYWIERMVTNDARDAVAEILPYYHIGYGSQIGAGSCGGFGFGSGECPDALESEVRALHKAVGNFDPDGFEFVAATGSTQLIAAVAFALAGGETAASHFPYYSGHASAVEYFNGTWEAAATALSTKAPNVEFVTSPSNPDGAMVEPEVPGAIPVWDNAYFWPHFTPVYRGREAKVAAGDGVALFTLSKLTGHASSRVGWAWTKNATLAQSLRGFCSVNGGMSRESNLRASEILASERRRGYPVLGWAGRLMRARWDALEDGLRGSACLALQSRGEEARDAWSGDVHKPAPPYAWVECKGRMAEDCYGALLEGGVKGRPGPQYGGGKEHARVELLMSDANFQTMLPKLLGVGEGDC